MAQTIALDEPAAIAATLRNPATAERLDQHDVAEHTNTLTWGAELYQLIPIGAYTRPWVVRTVLDSRDEFELYDSLREAEASLVEAAADARIDFFEACGGH